MDFLDFPPWVQKAFKIDARWGYFAARAKDEVPQAFIYRGTFPSTAKTQSPITLVPDQAIPADMYVQEMGYDVEQPNFAPGSVFAPQANLANAQQPGIDVELEMGGGFLGDQYNVNIGLAPIQMIIPWIGLLGRAGCPWPGKWYMTYSQQLIITAFLSKNLADSQVPYNLSVVLRAKRIACPGFRDLTLNGLQQRMVDEFGVRDLPGTLGLNAALGGLPPWGLGKAA